MRKKTKLRWFKPILLLHMYIKNLYQVTNRGPINSTGNKIQDKKSCMNFSMLFRYAYSTILPLITIRDMDQGGEEPQINYMHLGIKINHLHLTGCQGNCHKPSVGENHVTNMADSFLSMFQKINTL